MPVSRCLGCLILAIVLGTAGRPAWALTEFRSETGGFTVLLPGEPQEKVIENTDNDGKEYTQTQYQISTDQGTIVVSYQDNPQLVKATAEQAASALEKGRDALLNMANGPVRYDDAITLDETHAGRSFAADIPAMQGQIRARMYLVAGRLFQVIVVGTPEFAQSDEATEILESFKLLDAK